VLWKGGARVALARGLEKRAVESDCPIAYRFCFIVFEDLEYD